MTDVPADRIDEAIWRLNIDGLSQYDIERIVRVVVLPEVAAERQRLHDLEARIEALADDIEDEVHRWGTTEELFAPRLRALVSPVSDDTTETGGS